MAQLLGRRGRSKCVVCRTDPGPDCHVKQVSKRRARRIERREWMSEEEIP